MRHKAESLVCEVHRGANSKAQAFGVPLAGVRTTIAGPQLPTLAHREAEQQWNGGRPVRQRRVPHLDEEQQLQSEIPHELQPVVR